MPSAPRSTSTDRSCCCYQKQVVELFHRVAASVPAYREFLDDHDVDPDTVRTFADFQRLPLLT